MDVQAVKAKWNNMSTGAKAATVAGAVATTAAVATTTAAAIRGGKLSKLNAYKLAEDKFVAKTQDAAQEAKFADKIKGAWGSLKEGFQSIFTKEGREAWKGTEELKGQKELFTELKAQLKTEKAASKAAEAAEGAAANA